MIAAAHNITATPEALGIEPMTDKKLTPKQELFVQEYLKDLNATQAAIRAGYSENTARAIGQENLTKPVIKAAVEKAMSERVERIQVDQDYVLRVITETIERCMQAAPVRDAQGNPVMVETPDGEVVPAYAFNPQAVLKGAELLGKHKGMFVEKREVTGKDGQPLANVTPVINLTVGKA